MFEIGTKVELDYGHRLTDYEGKCKNPHGHYGVVEVLVKKEDLDKSGFVIDFGIIKNILKEWLDSHWDHAMILNYIDRDFIAFEQEHNYKCYVLDVNPTAENLARFLHDLLKIRVADLEKVSFGVRFFESPNQYAEYWEGVK